MDGSAAAEGVPRPSLTLPAGFLDGVRVGYTAMGRRQRRRGLPTVAQAARAGYKPLSVLTGGAYPAFTPGIGSVYVRQEDLPGGPFLAFDRKGRQVSTIYKVPPSVWTGTQGLPSRDAAMPPVDHVVSYAGNGHPGVDFPHWNLVLWHVPARDESGVAN